MMADSDAERKTDPLVLVGKVLLGRYLIEERLAQGGMSVVYRGTDERLHRPVCVKIFFGIDRSRVAYQTSYEHFVQEAFALSQLSHPNTIRIYDFGYLPEEPKSPFHVSELLDGGTLLGLIRREGPLAPATALDILEPIVGALSEAHSRGVVHRDIKPSNILFGRAGPRQIVKLADFGIAKAGLDALERAIPNRADDTNAAGHRISLYSPGWAAPEQLRSERVGPTADVFALGLLIAYMLSGRKVFSDSDVLKAVNDRMEGDAYLERALEAMHLPRAMTDVVGRACRVDPRQRYHSVDELLADYREAVERPDQPGSGVRTARFDRGGEPTSVARSPARPMPGELAPEPPVAAVPPPTPFTADAAPAAPAVPAAPVDGPLLVLAELSPGDVVAGGRRVRIVPCGEEVTLGGAADPVQAPGRFRLTFLPGWEGRVHVRGLNCFVEKLGGRATSAVDLDGDGAIELIAPDRARLDTVRLLFPRAADKMWHFPLGGATLAVPVVDVPRALLLDYGPGRETVLLCRRRGSA